MTFPSPGFRVTGRIGSGAVHVNGRHYEGRDFEYSERFDTAQVRLRITVDVGSGDLRIRTAPGGGAEV